VKVTEYFKAMRLRPDRSGIKEEWIQETIANPLREEIQLDGRIRRWSKVTEANGKYLRVILLDDEETVHNAFFDSGFKEENENTIF
jgi:hypothetical protein